LAVRHLVQLRETNSAMRDASTSVLSEDSFALLSLESLVVIKQGFQAFCEELHTAMENLHSAPSRPRVMPSHILN
jgi:hypothetical protein